MMDCNRPMEFIHYNQCHLHLEISCQQDSPYCMFHHRHKIVSLWHWLLVLAKEVLTGSLLHVLIGTGATDGSRPQILIEKLGAA